MYSWRVLILKVWHPLLFAQYRMSEPWNSPHNSLLASQMPHQYCCGLAPSLLPADQTTYVAVVGPNTVMRTSEHDPRRQEDIPKDAVMLIELPDKPRHWMSPVDASPEEVAAYFSGITHDSPRHEHYSTADVRVRPVRELTDKELVDRINVAVPQGNQQ